MKHNINKILMQNEMFSINNFEAYDVIIMDKKYTIKKHNLHEITSLPLGISTSYLNVNNEFGSIGYMGFTQSKYKHFFLSVEEKAKTHINTNNFEYFETNEDQILYFIFDFLHVLDQLKIYNIRLLSQSILFAVVESQKRLKFRVDDIGLFNYVRKPNLCENHVFLMTVLENLFLVINERNTSDFVRDLIFAANELRNAEYDYYIEILILKVEKELNNC